MIRSYSVKKLDYCKSLKFQTLFFFCSQIKCWLSGLEFKKKCFRIANRADPDQTASSEAVWSGSALFVLAFFGRQLVFKILDNIP